MHELSGWQPATTAERLRTIDILRGLALFGVLMINLLTVFRLPLLEHIHNPSHSLVEAVAKVTLEFKAVTIFSFLFGAGVAIQFDRAQSRGVSARLFLVRRLAWLFVLGSFHLFLIWNGDVLALYAICGLLLIPFLGLSWRWLLAIGAAWILLPGIASFGLPLPSGPAAAALIEQARITYGTGGFIEIQRFRWHETWTLIVPLLIGIMPRTAGLMFLGAAAWGSGIMRDPIRHRRKLIAAFAIGAAIGIPPAFDAPMLLALTYVSGLLLWLTPERAAKMPGLAALGQMALTNYLLQSIVLGFVFYGYGLGLFGRIGPELTACIGVALYAVQVPLSRAWLRRFRFGPFEWLWRSLTYGQRQPMRRDILRAGCSGRA